MQEENPYRTPASSIVIDKNPVPRRWGLTVLVLAGFQTLVTAVYASTALNQVRHGEISVLVFLAWMAAGALLAIGALLLLHSPRPAAYSLFVSALFGSLTSLQWHPVFVFTGTLLAVCAGLIAFAFVRRSSKPFEQ